MNDVTFQIPKQKDRVIIDSVLKAFEISVYKTQLFKLTTILGNPLIQVTSETFQSHQILMAILDKNSELLNNFVFLFPDPLQVQISRAPNQPLDNVNINLHQIAGTPTLVSQNFQQDELIDLVTALKKNLRALDLSRSLVSSVSKEAKKFYENREAEVVRLENTVAKIVLVQRDLEFWPAFLSWYAE